MYYDLTNDFTERIKKTNERERVESNRVRAVSYIIDRGRHLLYAEGNGTPSFQATNY